MANFRCEDCGLDMIEDDSSGPEPCPRCGKDMVRSEGVVLKNFGGGGYAAPDQPATGK
jgi:predicted Zn-ribbon and HTH transcriptional regulator